jgi:diguanylate cyclase (GGDEF)-like protein
MKRQVTKPNGKSGPRSLRDAQLIADVGALAGRLLESVEPERTNGERPLLARALAAASEVQQRFADQNARIQYLENLAIIDELTALLNRRGFNHQLRRTLASSKRYGDLGVLVVCDLDNFKAINDAYGHAVGDEVLCHTAKILNANVRQTDIVARLGGDEFAVLMVQTSWRDGFKRARGLNRVLNRSVAAVAKLQIQINASFGVEPFGPHDEEDNLVARADMAMYCNKRKKSSLAFITAAE